MYRTQPLMRGLEPGSAVQAWVFQQFLPLLVLAPVAASMSVAAYTVIGEKQARTLEPLLATPITTFELLLAKVLGALVPAVALTFASFAVYGARHRAVRAMPGAVRVLLAPRSLGMVFLLGPLAALAALQLAVCVSSRVNDARSAQQIGALIILPLAGLLVGQLTGAVALTGPLIAGYRAGARRVERRPDARRRRSVRSRIDPDAMEMMTHGDRSSQTDGNDERENGLRNGAHGIAGAGSEERRREVIVSALVVPVVSALATAADAKR